MSTNSILELSQERYAQEAEDVLLRQADAYHYKQYFMVGEGADLDKMIHAYRMNRIFNSQNCDIVNYVADKIAGRLEEAGHKTKKRKLTDLKECCQDTSCDFDKCLNIIEF